MLHTLVLAFAHGGRRHRSKIEQIANGSNEHGSKRDQHPITIRRLHDTGETRRAATQGGPHSRKCKGEDDGKRAL